LEKKFDGVPALAGLTLQLPPSGITALIGPNGAGKTTLINVLTGFEKPDSGCWYFGGRDVSALPPHEIARLGVARTFQDLRLIREMSALENVMLARPRQEGEKFWRALVGARACREEVRCREAGLAVLQRVGLVRVAGERAGDLSYGQQKLLALACCVATDARLLLLDEPIAGLDPKAASDVVDIIQRLREEGKVVIFVEHDIASVHQLADEVVVMGDGRVIAQGPASEILAKPEIMETYLA
jgi:ABC-type branched-subunit amino acid transport system ATPase component